MMGLWKYLSSLVSRLAVYDARSTPLPVHDRSQWRTLGGTERSLGTLKQCDRCLMRWDAKYQQAACKCTLPRQTSELDMNPTRLNQAPAAINSGAFKLNTERTVAVALDTYFNEDMTACPRGTKLQLLSIGGIAVYGEYRGEAFWTGWAPVPRRRPQP